MIVRIATEGQFKLPEDAYDALNELDNATVASVEAGDEAAFKAAYAKIIEYVQSNGEALDGDDLCESDLILPPSDISLEEAKHDFSGDGLLPD